MRTALGANAKSIRAYDVDQDVVDALIDAPEYKRCPVLRHAYDFGGHRAGRGLLIAEDPKDEIQLGALAQLEVLGFDEGAIETDVPESALLYLATVIGNEHFYIGHATRT